MSLLRKQMFLMDWLKLTKEKGKQMFKIIKICTKRGIEIDVATYSKGYLAVWKRDNDSKAIFSTLPRIKVSGLRQAKQEIQAIYRPDTVI